MYTEILEASRLGPDVFSRARRLLLPTGLDQADTPCSCRGEASFIAIAICFAHRM